MQRQQLPYEVILRILSYCSVEDQAKLSSLDRLWCSATNDKSTKLFHKKLSNKTKYRQHAFYGYIDQMLSMPGTIVLDLFPIPIGIIIGFIVCYNLYNNGYGVLPTMLATSADTGITLFLHKKIKSYIASEKEELEKMAQELKSLKIKY